MEKINKQQLMKEILEIDDLIMVTWQIYRKNIAECPAAKKYFWEEDYHGICSSLAGFASQIRAWNQIKDPGRFLCFISHKFISKEIIEEYFINCSEPCYIVIAHLNLLQAMFDRCLLLLLLDIETI